MQRTPIDPASMGSRGCLGRSAGLRLIAPAILCAGLAGCASGGGTVERHPHPNPAPSSSLPTTPAAGTPPYRPTAAETAMDCRKLTGRVQVGIVQARAAARAGTASASSKEARQLLQPLLDPQGEPADPERLRQGRYARLLALNALLVEKRCKSYDVDGELAKPADPNSAPPLPTRPAPG